MQLTAENYYSKMADFAFMSVSQFKGFSGSYGRTGCEAAAIARIRGEYDEGPSTAMLVGSYVDAWFEGTIDDFKASHPDLFTQKGELRATYKKAEEMIARASRDKLFMQYMSGEKQVIMTGELFGAKWKIKMDSYIPGKAIVDLKCMSSLTKMNYTQDAGYLDFVRYWGYDIQGAVYQEIVRQNTGKKLPFFIAGISKEEAIDIEVIGVNDLYLKEALQMVEREMPHILEVKTGKRPPDRCGICKYCRDTKVLMRPISISEIAQQIPTF